MVSIEIKNCDEFFKTWQFLESFNEIVNVNCDKDAGIQIQACNHAKTCVAELTYPAAYFEKYECKEDVTIGVATKVLTKILKNAYKKQDATLKITKPVDKADIQISIATSAITCEYTVKTMDVDSERFDIPNPPKNSTYHIPSETWKAWKDILYDGDVTLTPQKNSIQIVSTDSNSNKVNFVGDVKSEDWKTSYIVKEKVKDKKGVEKVKKTTKKKNWKSKCFAHQHFKHAYAMMGISSEVCLQFYVLDQVPMLLYTELSHGARLNVWVAPKENEDEDEDEEEEVSAPQQTATEVIEPPKKRAKVVAAH